MVVSLTVPYGTSLRPSCDDGRCSPGVSYNEGNDAGVWTQHQAPQGLTIHQEEGQLFPEQVTTGYYNCGK